MIPNSRQEFDWGDKRLGQNVDGTIFQSEKNPMISTKIPRQILARHLLYIIGCGGLMMFVAKDGSTLLKEFARTTGWISLFMLGVSTAHSETTFTNFQTHSHLVIPVDPKVTYTVEKIEQNGILQAVILKLENVTTGVVPFKNIQESKDDRTEKILMTRTPGQDGENVTLEIRFTEKAKKQGIEFFDYLSKTPLQLQFDYWLSTEKPEMNKVAETPIPTENHTDSKTKATKPTVNPKLFSQLNKKKSIKSATVHTNTNPVGCTHGLDRNKDAMIPFKLWEIPYAYKNFFKLDSPDMRYQYPIEKKLKNENFGARNKEISHYRLAIKLYRDSQFALALRTIKFFETSFPKSPLKPEIEFLTANTFLKLSKLLKSERYKEKAFELFRKITIESAESDRTQLAITYFVQEYMDTGKYLKALEFANLGLNFKANNKNNPLEKEVFRLAVAESLFELGEYEKAEKEFQSVIDANTPISPEAAFRVGSVFAARGFMERAAIAYESAIRRFPKNTSDFPQNWFNLSETYFKLDRLKDAQKFYSDYLEKFSTTKYISYVRYRLAEIEDLISTRSQTTAQNAIRIKNMYEDVVNKHPFSSASHMAQLRLSQCQFDDQASKKEFYDAYFNAHQLEPFADPLVDAKDIEVAYELSQTRFYNDEKEDEEALKNIAIYRNKYVHSTLAAEFKKRFSESSERLVLKLSETDAGEELGIKVAKKVINLTQEYQDVLPQPGRFKYMLAILKAEFALGMMDAVAKRIPGLQGQLANATDDEKDDFHYLSSRFLRLSGETPEKVIVELSMVRGNENGGGALSAIKLYDLAALSLARNGGKGDLSQSTAYYEMLLKNDLYKKLSRERQIGTYLQYVENLSRMGRKDDVVRWADSALIRYTLYNELSEQIMKIKEFRAQALYDLGDDKKALIAFGEILTGNPKHRRQKEFEFNRAKILARTGHEDEAMETFKKLAASSSDDVWKKSAQDELEQLQWENKK